MPLTTSAITGRVVLPNNAAFTNGVLTFTLSEADTELQQVIAPAGYRVALDDDELPAGTVLWRNTEGARGSSYSVALRADITTDVPGGGTLTTRKTYALGSIQVGDEASYTIGELLRNPVPVTSSSADRVDLGALDAAVAATAADRTATEAARNAALIAETNAELAETQAEAARDAAFVNANVYADIATGRAAVTDGQQFMVVSGSEIIRYRRDSSSTQTEMARYPSAASLFGAAYRASLQKNTRKIVENSGSITPSVYRVVSWVSGTNYQIEAIARAGERRFLNLFCNGGFQFNATFDLELGAASGAGASIVALGEGWFRCRVIGVAGATFNANLQCRMFNSVGASAYTGDGTSGLFVDNVSLVQVGVGTELLASGDLSTAGWTKLGVTVTTPTVDNLGDGDRLIEALAAILGVMSADKFIEASGASVSPSVFRSTGATTIGSTYEHKVVAKAGERHRLNLFNNGGFNYDCTFDLLRGTASGAGASITHLGEGWYECAVTKAATGTTSGNCQLRIYPATGGHPYAGDGTSGLFVNSASLKKDGVEQWGDGNLFGGSSWSKASATVSADVALFRTITLDGMAVEAQPYQGLKWAALGTSITAQNQYVPVVANLLGLTSQNLGVSGGSIASGAHYGSLAIYNAISSIAVDSNLVTIEAGTNDFGTDNSDLGALGDTTTATFYGALYASVVAIQARAPSAKIVFLTPYSGDSRTSTYRHFRTNSKGHTLRQFQIAVQEVAAFLGLPCIDVGQEAGLGYLTLGPYSSDGLHINATGGTRFGSYVAEKLLELADAGMMAT